MWREAFFLLLLANLVFFAWSGGYFGGQEEGRESARLAGQVYPERLRVVSRPAGEPAPEDATPSAAAEPPDFLVHIPPLPGKAAADKKAAELARLGIKDFQVAMEEGPDQFSIIFGHFNSEQAANEFLAGLVGKGVRSARVQAIGAAAP